MMVKSLINEKHDFSAGENKTQKAWELCSILFVIKIS